MLQKLLISLIAGLLVGCATEPTPLAPAGSRRAAPADLAVTRTVGTGTGDLTVDGNVLGIKPGDILVITPGRYSGVTLANLNGAVGRPIRVLANGLVEVVGGEVALRDVSYLTLDGGASAKNLLLRDNTYRAITISGAVPHALTLQGIRARNIADYTISYNNKTTYNRTDATAFTDFRLLYCDFENTGTLHFNGELNRSAGLVNTGFMKNAEVGYCTFKNSPTAGALLYFGNAENLNIHHNVVDNVNAKTNSHNGIFFLRGNGSVHHNKCTNHQGNFVRFWTFSQGIFPKEVLFYNNIVWNSRKYSALELQSFAENMMLGISTYCNAKVYNNTVGKMNTTLPTEYVGVVVDLYNLFGGSLQLFNNLSFDQVKTTANDGIWSQLSSTRPFLIANNHYYSTASTAGLVDEISFRLKPTSPAKNLGLYRFFMTDDFYDTRRSYRPSVGAVE